MDTVLDQFYLVGCLSFFGHRSEQRRRRSDVMDSVLQSTRGTIGVLFDGTPNDGLLQSLYYHHYHHYYEYDDGLVVSLVLVGSRRYDGIHWIHVMEICEGLSR